MLGGHFKQQNYQQRTRKCEKRGRKHTMKMTLLTVQELKEDRTSSHSMGPVHQTIQNVASLQVCKCPQKRCEDWFWGHQYILASRHVLSTELHEDCTCLQYWGLPTSHFAGFKAQLHVFLPHILLWSLWQPCACEKKGLFRWVDANLLAHEEGLVGLDLSSGSPLIPVPLHGTQPAPNIWSALLIIYLLGLFFVFQQKCLGLLNPPPMEELGQKWSVRWGSQS